MNRGQLLLLLITKGNDSCLSMDKPQTFFQHMECSPSAFRIITDKFKVESDIAYAIKCIVTNNFEQSNLVMSLENGLDGYAYNHLLKTDEQCRDYPRKEVEDLYFQMTGTNEISN